MTPLETHSRRLELEGIEQLRMATLAVQAVKGPEHPLVQPTEGHTSLIDHLTDEHAVYTGHKKRVIINALHKVAEGEIVEFSTEEGDVAKISPSEQRAAQIMLGLASATIQLPPPSKAKHHDAAPTPVPLTNVSYNAAMLYDEDNFSLTTFEQTVTARRLVGEFMGEDHPLVSYEARFSGHSLLDVEPRIYQGADAAVIRRCLQRASNRHKSAPKSDKTSIELQPNSANPWDISAAHIITLAEKAEASAVAAEQPTGSYTFETGPEEALAA